MTMNRKQRKELRESMRLSIHKWNNSIAGKLHKKHKEMSLIFGKNHKEMRIFFFRLLFKDFFVESPETLRHLIDVLNGI